MWAFEAENIFRNGFGLHSRAFYLIEARQLNRWTIDRRLLEPGDQVKEFGVRQDS
jgi:hypothetical protein